MTMRNNRAAAPRPLALAAAFTAALGLQGCSDDGFGKRYPVTGTVTYDGKPLESGKVNFVPEAADGQPAGGSIVNGKYNLTTHTPDDGALPGKYKVMITSFGGDLSKVQEEANAAGGAQNAMPDQTAVAAAQKSLIPEKYGSFEGSGLTAEVQAKANSLDFDLKP